MKLQKTDKTSFYSRSESNNLGEVIGLKFFWITLFELGLCLLRNIRTTGKRMGFTINNYLTNRDINLSVAKCAFKEMMSPGTIPPLTFNLTN